MVSRASKLTPLDKTQVYFSDFLNDLDSHPINYSIARVTNEGAVRQSIRNLIMTGFGERFFQPTIGSDVQQSLFEPNDIITAENITFFIKSTIKQNEPRALLMDVIVTPDPNNYIFQVSILFSVVNSTAIHSLDIILKRVR
jgi:phage baseplate assembly protein W